MNRPCHPSHSDLRGEMMKVKPLTTGCVVLLFAVFFMVFQGFAADNTICACSQRATGALRMVSCTTGKCLASEAPVSWNITGPQGLPGSPGVANGISVAVHGTVANDGTKISR